MSYTFFKKNIAITIFLSIIYAQVYIPADPYNLLFSEKKAFMNNRNFGSLSLRPTFYSNSADSNVVTVKYRSELFYNSNAPNLENMSDRWIGKGAGMFSSINLSFRNKYIMGSIEPYYFISQNANYENPSRNPLFSRLNDNQSHHLESPYQAAGLREFQLYLHKNGIGGGISNANMWWGPGIHSAIVMTNNTSGFTNILLGTLEEKRFKDWGFIGRWTFSKFDDRNTYEPYFTSMILGVTYYSDPVVSIGLTRAIITGGSYTEKSDSLRWFDAALSLFTSKITSGDNRTYEARWSPDDQMISGYVSTYFPKSKLTLFIEIGRTDIAWDIDDFLLTPDHAIATNFGMRKYNLFNKNNLFFGMEYIKILTTRFIGRNPNVGPWNNRPGFEFNSFNGRHFGPHSGPDSDDFIVYVGWQQNNFTIIPSFNYERHGVRLPAGQKESGGFTSSVNTYPEVKIEFRLDLRYVYKEYLLNMYLERETVNNLEFRDKERTGTVIWFGVEKNLRIKNINQAIKKIFNRF